MMNFSHLIASLQQNKLTSLRVVLHPRFTSAAIAEWIAALQVNESVKHVDLLCAGDFQPSASAWQSLLGALLGLPNLKTFQMRGCSTAHSRNTKDFGIPLEAFATINSPQLTSFSLAQLVLSCEGPQDLQDFASAMKGRTELREFQLISIGLEGSTDQEQELTTSSLTPLLKNLAALPKLENLEVSGTFTPLGVLEEEEVPRALFQSKSLKRLSVSDFIFSEAALSSIIHEDLSKNFCLKELAISGNLTRQVAPKLSHLLAHNKTLEAVALRVDNFDDEASNQELVKAIGGSHLQVVSLCSFFGRSLSPASRTAFSKMLETNCHLEYLYVPCPYTDTAFWDQVRLYLGLNASGRRRVNKRFAKDEAEEKKDDSELDIRSAISRSFYLMANKNASAAPLTPKRTSSKPTVSLMKVASSSSPGKRHQKMVNEARLAKKRRFPVVPTQGLSSMFIR